MSDFNKPQIRLHTVNMREQFVAPFDGWSPQGDNAPVGPRL